MGKTNTVRLVDIARKVGVSHVAAGAVLLGSGKNSVRVGKETSEKIRRVAREMNYQPNMAARQLKGMRSNVIGVIIDSYAPKIFFDRLSEMERQAAQSGYRFMVGQSHGEIDRLEAYAQDFASRGIDGLICISHDYPRQTKQVKDIFAVFNNVVFIGKPKIKNEDISFIAVDVADGVYQGCDYLIKQSRKNIGLLLWSSGASTMKERLSGYRRALRLNDLNVNKNLIRYIGTSETCSIDDIKPFVQDLVKNDHADAIVAVNDKVALMTIRCLENMGLRIPEDVAVLGFDNIELAELCKPALTTVDQQSKELSQTAVKMLVNLIEGKESSVEERQKIIKPKLIVRQSA